MYGNGAAMGFSPDQVDSMSLWEYAACVDGHRHFHGAEDEAEPPSYDDHLKMLQRAQAMQDRTR